MSINFSVIKPLILASASPRRADLLKEWKIFYRIKPSEIREFSQENAPYFTPVELALANAFLKAKQVAFSFERNWVLGVDTIVVFKSKIFGKPRDLAEAKEMLQRLSAQTHRVISGLALIRKKPYAIRLSWEVSYVTFRSLTLSQIETYLQEVPVLDKAGAYAAQEKGSWLIHEIRGSKTNVIGLPKSKTFELLAKVNFF